MKKHSSSKTLLTIACLSFILFLLAGTGCAKKAARPAEKKAAQPVKTWVIYVEGYNGTDQYDLPNKSRPIKLSIDGGRREVLGNFKGQVDDIALSPVGGKLAFTAEGKLKILDLKSKRIITEIAHKSKTTFISVKGERTETHTCACEYEEVRPPIWSPDGTTLACIRMHYGLGVNWATLDTFDLRTMHLSQADPDYENFITAHLKTWVPGTKSVIVDISENKDGQYKPQHLALLDLTNYKVSKIVEDERFLGLWNGATLLSYTLIPQNYQEKIPVDKRTDIYISASNLGRADAPNRKIAGLLNRYIKSPVPLVTTSEGDIFYADSYVSGKTLRTYQTYHKGKVTEQKVPIRDYSRFWRIDPSHNKRTLIAKEKDFFIRDLWVSKDGRYLVFYREPFVASEFGGGPWRQLVELAVCDTKTGRIKVLASSSGRVGVKHKEAFTTGVPLAVYTEK